MKTKIALIGAGGEGFAAKFIPDILARESLKDCHIALTDIHEGRLDSALKIARLVVEEAGGQATLTATTDLAEAVKDADFVLTIFRVGTLAEQRLEYEIPKKYGVDQVVADTLGPGGIFRGIRVIPALLEVLDAMEQHCPGAYLLNYVNPMSINTIALSQRAKTVQVVGLCHSVQHTARRIAKFIGIEPADLRYWTAGVNHQAFFLKLEADGKDVYPVLREAMEKPEIYEQERVRFEMLRHFDHFVTESSGHNSEYNPYFRKRPELIEAFCRPLNDTPVGRMMAGVSGAALEVCEKKEENFHTRVDRVLSGETPVQLKKTEEYGIQIIEAVTTDTLFRANLNVMNDGLIANLPSGCSVEVPCLIDGAGIHPCVVEDYPEQLAALNRDMINVHMLAAKGAVSGSRRAVFHAIAHDPLTSAVCSLEEIQAMTDELFEALRGHVDKRFYQE